MALTEIALLKWQTNESLVFEDCWFAVQLSRGTWGKSRSYLNPILPGLFGHSQPRGVFGTTPCNSFIWPSINLKLGTSIGMSKKYSQKIAELLLKMTWQWRHLPFLQLLSFLSDFVQIFYRDAYWYNKQKYKILLRLIEKWRHDDVITDFEDPICPKVPFKECIAMAIWSIVFC